MQLTKYRAMFPSVISFRIKKKEKQLIKNLCQQQGKSVSEYFRELTIIHLKKIKS